MVFYRKYRPQKFSEVIGQEPIVETLSNALASSSFSHGYLFAGPRGTGKTTLARILAKALNCTARKLGKNSFEPCNKCLSCREITLGKSLDLIEIDAASNRGIDEIRDLREKIRFAPVKSAYKIYIIDEVHMLTKEAFNALLKTLEEPPKHAIFIMATTEPQKVPLTILSRVQRFDFRRAKANEIQKLLKKVAVSENVKIDEAAVQLLSQLSFGAFRDGLTLFDQVASVRKTTASKITLEQVQEILGLAHEKSIFDFIENFAQKDRQKAFKLIAGLYQQGVDLENFTLKLVEILRKIALFKIGENQLFDLTSEQQEEAKRLGEFFEINELMSVIQKFAFSLPQIKASPLPQLPLEMVVYGYTQNQNEKLKIDKDRGDAPSEMPVSRFAKGEIETRLDRVAESEGRPEATKLNKDLWSQIVKEAKAHNHSLAALLRDAVLAESRNETITLAFKFKFHANMVSAKKNCQIIEGIIEKITGSRYRVVCVVNPEIVIQAPSDTEEELINGAKEVFEVEE